MWHLDGKLELCQSSAPPPSPAVPASIERRAIPLLHPGKGCSSQGNPRGEHRQEQMRLAGPQQPAAPKSLYLQGSYKASETSTEIALPRAPRFLDSTLTTARDKPNSRALTVASPTQLPRSPLRKPSGIGQHFFPCPGWTKQTPGEWEGHIINNVNTTGAGGSPSTSFQRDTFISPQLPPGDEGGLFQQLLWRGQGASSVVPLCMAAHQCWRTVSM